MDDTKAEEPFEKRREAEEEEGMRQAAMEEVWIWAKYTTNMLKYIIAEPITMYNQYMMLIATINKKGEF